jgi:hypothetical protein
MNRRLRRSASEWRDFRRAAFGDLVLDPGEVGEECSGDPLLSAKDFSVLLGAGGRHAYDE